MTIAALQKDLLTKHQNYLNALNNYHQMVIIELERRFDYCFYIQDFNKVDIKMPVFQIDIRTLTADLPNQKEWSLIKEYIKQFNTSFVFYTLY